MAGGKQGGCSRRSRSNRRKGWKNSHIFFLVVKISVVIYYDFQQYRLLKDNNVVLEEIVTKPARLNAWVVTVLKRMKQRKMLGGLRQKFHAEKSCEPGGQPEYNKSSEIQAYSRTWRAETALWKQRKGFGWGQQMKVFNVSPGKLGISSHLHLWIYLYNYGKTVAYKVRNGRALSYLSE